MLARLLTKSRREATPQDILCEARVTLSRCTLLGSIRVGYRSYANESLLRNVDVGRFCSIGRRCSIGGALHDIECFSTHPATAASDFISDPHTRIGNDVWIGDNVLIISGITVGDGAVIGGGAVVTRDVEPYSIVAGVPGRTIRERFDAPTGEALRRSQWWRYGDAVTELVGPGASPMDLIRALEKVSPPALEPHFRPWQAA